MDLDNDKDLKLVRKIQERVEVKINLLRESIADMYHISPWLINTVLEEAKKVMK